jgi:error-prone DNA polymerase
VPAPSPGRFASIEDLIRRTGLRHDEVTVLAEIGALNSLGYDRRAALWQIERAVRPAGALFTADQGDGLEEELPRDDGRAMAGHGLQPAGRGVQSDSGLQAAARSLQADGRHPLSPMTPIERMTADYAGTSLTIGPHPMTMRRHDLAARGVQRAVDLPRGRTGQRVRTAGMVITRQRPGTAKGFVFLTLEDETGIANVIVRPALYESARDAVVSAPFLLVEGILQNIDGVTSVKAERLEPLGGLPAAESHDFS